MSSRYSSGSGSQPHAGYACSDGHLVKLGPSYSNNMLALTKTGEEVRLGAKLSRA